MRHRLTRIAAVMTLVLAPHAGGAQGKPEEDRWALIRPLLGTWEGTSEGQPGTGTVRRTYALTLGDQFVEVRNTSTYPPQTKNPKGEVHEDRGYISFDKATKRLCFRQFHVEGFVAEYAQDGAASADRIVFSSAEIENIPPGWTARETYILHRT